MDKNTSQHILDSVVSDYDAIAAHFSHTRSHQWYEVSFLIEQYISPGQHVLDLGCGNGRVADLTNEIKAHYTGLDVSAELIAKARTLHPNEEFVVGSMLDTPFEDNQFDHTLLVASFHHIPSEELRVQALTEITRITKPGGYIIMTNWNLHQWKFARLRYSFNIKKLLRKHNMDWNDTRVPWKDNKKNVLAQRYYHGFTMREMKQLAKKANLTLVSQYYETHGMHVPRRTGQNLVSVLHIPS